MAVNWVTFFGGSAYVGPFQALSESIQGATTAGFYLQDAGGQLLSFQGQFTLDAGGNITGGTITDFKGFLAGLQVLNAYGYQMDFSAFNAARLSPESPALADLLLPAGFTLNGTAFNDDLIGGRFGDILVGLGGDDTIDGRGGNDAIRPGEGRDDVNGGDGEDVVSYADRTSPVDVVLKGPDAAVVKVGGLDEDTIRNVESVFGGTANDRLRGDGSSNGLFGFDGDDRIEGNDGNDTLAGNDGRDKLDGGTGNDRLIGGLGNDTLKGGKNSDSFAFVDALDKSSNVDKIKDFKVGVDEISLYQGVFSALTVGDLKAKHFHEGRKAADGDDHIIYNDGTLSYDADGKGGVKQVPFAVLKGAPDISAHDFVLI